MITFSPTEGELPTPCSSLLITTERRRSHKSRAASDYDEDVGQMILQILSLADRSLLISSTGEYLRISRN